LPSDEVAYREFLYSLGDSSIYYRFFHQKRLFSHAEVQRQWASVDYRKSMTIIGMGPKGGYKEIVCVGSYAPSDTADFAEVAFVTRESYQGHGLASYLLAALEDIAKANDYKGFSATVLRDNGPMLRVFEKRYPEMKTSMEPGGEIIVTMPF
jgi:GNAT superfamily N-acetyltransferase